MSVGRRRDGGDEGGGRGRIGRIWRRDGKEG